MTAMVFGEVYRRDGEWGFSAIDQPTKDISIEALSKKFKQLMDKGYRQLEVSCLC